jgi:hypothetical protein
VAGSAVNFRTNTGGSLKKINVFATVLGVLLLAGVFCAVEASQSEADKSASWVDRTDFKGDMRYRHESLYTEGNKDRNRHRVRIRAGFDANVNETVKVGFQIASGSGDPVSTNQSFDGGFSSKSIVIDLAYFVWRPHNFSGVKIIGGKMKNPFYLAGKSELVWDADIRPEGGLFNYSRGNGDWDFFANLGGFWLEERSGGDDTGLLGAQAGFKRSCDAWHFLVGGSYYDYTNIKHQAPLFDAADPFGNSVDAAGNYKYDYDVFESFAEFGTKISNVPVSVYGNYAQNLASKAEENQGWMVGTTIGKTKDPHSWSVRYVYREIEADALPGIFTDSDFIGGGTDGNGHELGFDYQIADNWKLSTTFFDNERGLTAGSSDFQRLQIDLKFKF